MIVTSTIQIVIAIALAIILFVIAFSVYNMETVRAIQESGKIKKRTDIFKGVKDLSQNKDEIYNTIDPTHPTYRDLGDSINQKAGAEYTYNFWMYLQKPSTGSNIFGTDYTGVFYTDNGFTQKERDSLKKDVSLNKPLILFLRGNKNTYVYKNLCSGQDNNTEYKADVLVKNPMIKLEKGGDVLSVELNTVSTPDAVQERSRDTCGESLRKDWEAANKHKIAVKGLTEREELQDKWFMVSLVVQDTFPSDPIPLRNKVRVRLYVNGVLELDKYLDGKLSETSSTATVLKQNNGNFYLAPVVRVGTSDASVVLNSTDDVGKVRMADLSFFNYALDNTELSDLFSAGFSKIIAQGVTDNGLLSGAGSSLNDLSFASTEGILRPL